MKMCVMCPYAEMNLKIRSDAKMLDATVSFSTMLLVSHHHPAFIFAAACSARRYTGPCAIDNSQIPFTHAIAGRGLTMAGRNVGQSTRINDA